MAEDKSDGKYAGRGKQRDKVITAEGKEYNRHYLDYGKRDHPGDRKEPTHPPYEERS
jgi:hypothetical protein